LGHLWFSDFLRFVFSEYRACHLGVLGFGGLLFFLMVSPRTLCSFRRKKKNTFFNLDDCNDLRNIWDVSGYDLMKHVIVTEGSRMQCSILIVMC
jgi:hypothetical protein